MVKNIFLYHYLLVIQYVIGNYYRYSVFRSEWVSFYFSFYHVQPHFTCHFFRHFLLLSLNSILFLIIWFLFVVHCIKESLVKTFPKTISTNFLFVFHISFIYLILLIILYVKSIFSILFKPSSIYTFWLIENY